jgi:hypothetical protein
MDTGIPLSLFSDVQLRANVEEGVKVMREQTEVPEREDF